MQKIIMAMLALFLSTSVFGQDICNGLNGTWFNRLQDNDVVYERTVKFKDGKTSLHMVLDVDSDIDADIRVMIHVDADVDGWYSCNGDKISLEYENKDSNRIKTSYKIESKDPELQKIAEVAFDRKLTQDEKKTILKNAGYYGFKGSFLLSVFTTIVDGVDFALDKDITSSEKWKDVSIAGNKLTYSKDDGTKMKLTRVE